MEKKTNAIYEPGELDRVRGKLGVTDDAEAKRMAKILGGEVGVEKGKTPEPANQPRGQGKRPAEAAGKGGKRPTRRVDVSPDSDDVLGSEKSAARQARADPSDDPAVQLKTSYFERIKIDRYASQSEFEIKNSGQVILSILSFFRPPVDYVNPHFITRRVNEHYQKLEQLVTAARALLPRNNVARSERLRKASPFAFTVLETIRMWEIEKIGSEIARMQARPRTVKVLECADILRAVYKPLFILEKLDMENHIKGSFKLLYKILYLEDPTDAKNKSQELIRTALASLAEVNRSVRYFFHPLLMKIISDRWLPYEELFTARRRRFMVFLDITEEQQIGPPDASAQQLESGDLEALKEEIQKEQETAAENEEAKGENEETGEEDPNSPEAAARKAQEAAREAERKAQERARSALEVLFPKAGWERLSGCPDLYPYFANIYSLRKGYELIPPTDPLQQIAVLMHIIEDLFIALRNVKFGTVIGSEGSPDKVEDYLGDIFVGWRSAIETSFIKDYLPRLTEYCRLLENSAESKTSPYARKIINELHWIKRLCFLPYYKFESFGPPPFKKGDTVQIYSEVRTLRKYLTAVAMGIEVASRQGGADAKAPCQGIENPWQPYNFEVPNPVSKRLDALLAPNRRNNASLIFFTLSAATVLDTLINSDSSWAYQEERSGPLFRSVNGDGLVPMFGVDKKLDADQIFKDSLKKQG